MKAFSFASNRLKILLHFLAWLILLGLPLYFNTRWQVGNDFIWVYYINILITGSIFYINYIVLLPKLFFRNLRRWYFLSAFSTLLVFYFISDISNRLIFTNITAKYQTEESRGRPEEMRQGAGEMRPRGEDLRPRGEDRRPGAEDGDRPGPPGNRRFPGSPPFKQMHMINYTFISLFMMFFAMGLRATENQTRIEKYQKEMEKEKLNSELAFLKNQISPHFFFNTLNNIYALIEVNAEDSQKAVLKLSKLMRYLLYESEHGNTRLSKEIDFMYNYIDLMQLRLNKKIHLSVSFPENFEDVDIPPLLFIPFIENAFKHGISNRKKSFISIQMTIEGPSIRFTCSNSVADKTGEKEPEQAGIGLENVTKRLKLLFPGKHHLKIDASSEKYEVYLAINLAS